MKAPICPNCGERMERIREIQSIHIVWVWDEERRRYDKFTDPGLDCGVSMEGPCCTTCESKLPDDVFPEAEIGLDY
jgi:hypothetical protein